MANRHAQHSLILALDQGTTSTRACVFDTAGQILATAQQPLNQIFPQPGWVEHDPMEIVNASLAVCKAVIARAGDLDRPIAALGITNQRETAVIWDRASGQPVHNAIVWQDRRTAELCRTVETAGHAAVIQQETGLVIDAYFSASKIRWLLDNIPGLRDRADRGEVIAGTIDSFLIWHLTGGAVHATDTTNASRTMLFDIHRHRWSRNLLAIWDIPEVILPEVLESNATFGTTTEEVLGLAVPITGVAGDQHAATIGQACFEPGMAKCTYGTGAFLLMNTGSSALRSTNRLLTTPAYRIDGQTTYALEGSIFSAGSAVQWLRDGIGIIENASATEELVLQTSDNHGVYLVPAFTGLGAPWWDPDARGAITGITRDTGPANLARAALESVAYQTKDLLDAMVADGTANPVSLRVDGGMVGNDWLCQFIADIVDCPVQRPANIETTVLGIAILAGIGAGLIEGLPAAAAVWRPDLQFAPDMTVSTRERLYAGWHDAVSRVRTTP